MQKLYEIGDRVFNQIFIKVSALIKENKDVDSDPEIIALRSQLDSIKKLLGML